MRIYDSRSHRALASGSIEVEGRWSGVQWIALGMLVLLPIVAHSPMGLGVIGIAALYLFIFPTRRRVIFDARRRALRVEHAGLFREPDAISIPFDDLAAIVFQPAKRRGGRARYAVFARTNRGRVYLFTHAGERDTAELDGELRAMLGREG
jgi:hypothetical protein